jgi:hypothetical protein
LRRIDFASDLLHQRREVAHVRHLVVEQQHLRPDSRRHAADLEPIRRLADDLDGAAARQRQPQHLAKHFVVVGDHDPYGGIHIQMCCKPFAIRATVPLERIPDRRPRGGAAAACRGSRTRRMPVAVILRQRRDDDASRDTPRNGSDRCIQWSRDAPYIGTGIAPSPVARGWKCAAHAV